ncbi:MAG: SpoIIE family protein phosphatase [Planctomycetales bacterium]|nr:SpoIIE family protein phosphatase [Planctomycetales bacterium]NIM08598.1 SpoIIE family protein phosphatase [Planctomycetales bacterium]NIN08066.1 SpoIIE family protein phosphatase [Planctomycetales bacterium]NIN77200.1 SpoIIE family protein phosphatase [Planctomycetales bacterium]NIO34382.1 SpoIIE family protein phosphatase [Planctomycetales bacterium]
MTKPRLFCEQDMSQAEVYPLNCGSAAVFTTRCPGKETVSEDAAALLPVGPDAAVLIVADGLGGHMAGERAARLAIEKVRDAVENFREEGGAELRDAILNGIETANRAVTELAGDAATTLAVVEIQGSLVRPYHVGDSVILLIGNRGKIKLQTVSHSPVAYAVEAGLLDEQEAMHHEERHLISNIIGSPSMRIEIGPSLKMALRDTLILASDGLADNLHVHEIVERARKGPLPQVAQRIARDTLQRMQEPTPDHPSKADDLTFIAYRQQKTDAGGRG